ncbi:unnamed protein product [Rotaria sordida]|uniref:Cardiolipin synthase N-terminal domain-containing protein n=1 Tax=Rotaria sordida TaxID=392033 RepID=A0A818IR58_9BILA|nr:unnamed protein product [Rotaria sordida]CAF1016172.1 unnamed protein product [Rotaria sordida]CAF1414430.1 unnamed protein product [Rotaria sordida]CAF1628437.1 unnamed protein product [Rotaria sordida]CAF3528589.1 unnamed protein product [Rotaria sordida]
MSSFSVTLTCAFLLCFCNLVSANNLGPSIGGGIGGLIVLILDIIAIVDVLRSPRGIVGKLLWILLIILFPIGGLIIWVLCGRKTTAVV